MTKIRKLVYPAQPTGFTWELSADGQILTSGSANTEAEAQVAADKALKELHADQKN